MSGRRGQLLGYDARDGWKGWDTVEAHMPLSEMHGLIIDLRSLTQGVGTYEMHFDHLAELLVFDLILEIEPAAYGSQQMQNLCSLLLGQQAQLQIKMGPMISLMRLPILAHEHEG